MCEDKFVTAFDLALTAPDELSINLRHVRQAAEMGAIKRALSMTDGNYSAAAKLLGITRPTLYDLVKKYEINTWEDTER
jgi:two-component system NtrC family response regulator